MRKINKPEKTTKIPIRRTEYEFPLILRLDSFLVEKIKNALKSQHLGGNYQILNFSEFVRQSLRTFFENKLSITQPRNYQNPQREVCVKINRELWELWQQIPVGKRADLLHRILASYLTTVFNQ